MAVEYRGLWYGALRRIRILIASAALLLGCGGGSSSTPSVTPPPPPPPPPPADTLAPFGRIVFPLRSTMTDESPLTVTGTAGDDTEVASVRVNGVLAASDDGFATWRATVPLDPGTNSLVLQVTDRAGNVKNAADAVTVERTSPLWAAPSAIAADVAQRRGYVVDGTLDRVFRVDLTSGERTEIPTLGATFVMPTGATLAGGQLLVTDGLVASLFRVELSTGSRTVLVQGSPFQSPQGVAFDLANNRALVVDAGAGTLFGVDLTTNAVTSLVPGFSEPQGIAFDAAGNRAFVTDEHGLHQVDMGTLATSTIPSSLADAGRVTLAGGRAIVIDGAKVVSVDLSGAGSTDLAEGFAFPRGLAADGGRVLVVDPADDSVTAVDLALGTRTVLSRVVFGAGPLFVDPQDVAVDLVNQRLFVIDFAGGLYRVDVRNGDRTLLNGSGPEFQFPLSCAYDTRANRVLVTDTGRKALFGVDAATGARALISDGANGEGVNLESPAGIVFDRVNNLVFAVDTGLAALVAIDLLNGNRAILSGPSRGAGAGFSIPRAIDQDVAGDRFFVADTGQQTVFSVGLISGDRVPLTAPGPNVASITGVAFDQKRGRVLYTDSTLDGLFAFAPATPLALTPLDGRGPPLVSPDAVEYDLSGDLLLVVDSGLGVVFLVEPVSGDRVVLSK